jgi:Ca2+-transporting ATPase
MPQDNKKIREYHSIEPKKAIEILDSDINGLSEQEATQRREKFGPNEILEKKGDSPAILFLRQFKSFLIYILFAAAAISYYFNHMLDVYVILSVILINAAIGFIQEYRAEKAIGSLKKMIVLQAKVYRAGELMQIPASELIPGDIIFLEGGDKIPADARILEEKDFRTVEASLTGEALPISKFSETLPEKTSLADCKNMAWMGTYAASGEAKAIVVATGSQTAIGKIAKDLENIEDEPSHFEKKTKMLAKQMAFIAAIGACFVFIVGYFIRGFEFSEILIFTMASLVSATPAGLPAVLAIVLAVGAHRMAKRNAIIRRLPATETLGVVNTIITDKTGTLTENTLDVEKIILPGEDEFEVSGNGWEPEGDFLQKESIIFPLENRHLSKLLHIGAICNNARLIKKDGSEGYQIIGDPTEAALVVLAEKAGIKKEVLLEKELRLDDLPFNPERRVRASLVRMPDGSEEIYLVGAPEDVIKRSEHILIADSVEDLDDEKRKRLHENIAHLSRKAMRVLALAYRKTHKSGQKLSEDELDGLVIVGLVGMRDPIKQGVQEAVGKAHRAGISVIMATGDHKETAVAIAKEIGIILPHAAHPYAYTGEELSELSEKEFDKVIREARVFARLTPTMKLNIAESLQKQGLVVAMTGDGVNDAPALKKADIGISMGIMGTDVARESSEIILADDNFASMVNAIEEGRIVFRNTKQASSYLVTTNFAEQATIISTLFLGLPLPLTATQILWLNLVTDGVSVIPIAAEPGHNDVLDEPPRKAKEDILSKDILPFVALMAVTMLIIVVSIFYTFSEQGLEKARTGAFAAMAFTQLFNVLNMRSLKYSVFKIGIFSNKYIVVGLAVSVILQLLALYHPFIQNIFGFASLSALELISIIAICSSVLWLGELYKFIKGRWLDKMVEKKILK